MGKRLMNINENGLWTLSTLGFLLCGTIRQDYASYQKAISAYSVVMESKYQSSQLTQTVPFELMLSNLLIGLCKAISSFESHCITQLCSLRDQIMKINVGNDLDLAMQH